MSETNFHVKSKEGIGRYAVASKHLKPGDFIFEELPFAFGPKSDSRVLCLGCLSPVDCTYLCTKCSWPVCNSDCEKLAIHHDNECQVFSKSGAAFQPIEDPSEVCLQYECITPLRVLLAKDKNPERWQEEIEPMEHHNDLRKTKPIWQFNQTNIVDYLKGPCKINANDGLIHKICGILEVNAFEARTSSGYLIRCLYPKLAILSHNCVSNIHHTINCPGETPNLGQAYQVVVRAAVEIPQNNELYSSYTYSLWPTLVRRGFLKESKYFECECDRCKDKTELGTHLGTLKCNKCDNGVILSTDPLSNSCDWKCTHCEFKTTATAIRKVYATIQSEIDAIEMLSGPEGIESRETIFRKYRSVLHPKNSYMTQLRVGLTQLYGRADGYEIDDLPDILLEHKVELCQQLLDVLDVIEPGHSRIRGITLYELHSPLMILARNQYNSDVIDKEQFRTKMEQAVDTLEKSVEILKNEAENTPEGQLGLVATQALEGLRQNFELLIETA